LGQPSSRPQIERDSPPGPEEESEANHTMQRDFKGKGRNIGFMSRKISILE